VKSIGSSEQLNSVQVTKQHERGGIYYETLCVSKLDFSTGTAPLREDLLREVRRMMLVSSFVTESCRSYSREIGGNVQFVQIRLTQ
jgi:hypothetical protein